MTILLTGGFGYIGSHTYIELVKKGYDVIVVDNFSNCQHTIPSRLERITGKKPVYYDIDMMKVKSLRTVFTENKVNAVIHFAGLKVLSESISESFKYYKHNLQILFNLIEIMMEVGCKKLIFSSSCTVYGNVGKVDEIMKTGQNITSPYGKTKYFQEEILKDLYVSDPSWNITILRYFNPVANHPSGLIGELPNGTPSNLFPNIINSIKNGNVLKIFGNNYPTHDGTCIRDYVHVCDLADAHICALDKCDKLNIYNVGTGRKTSVMDIVTTFERSCGIKIKYIVEPPRSGDLFCVYADTKKINNELGWVSKRTIADMCKDVYMFVKN
jgi:UDP-glucose 4-epimerase